MDNLPDCEILLNKKESFHVSPNDISDLSRLEAGIEAKTEAATTTKKVQFSFSKDCFTPSVERITNNALKPLVVASNTVAPPSTMVKPNYEDILRRVSVVIYQHIDKCESKLKNYTDSDTLFNLDKLEIFSEENFCASIAAIHKFVWSFENPCR